MCGVDLKKFKFKFTMGQRPLLPMSECCCKPAGQEEMGQELKQDFQDLGANRPSGNW